jgi:hypothetical protein
MQVSDVRFQVSERIAGRGSRVAGATAIMLLAFAGGPGAAEETAPIPESEIVSLQKELVAPPRHGDSPVATRLALKNLVRRAQKLLNASPEATNRFAALGLVFEAQKRLLTMENSEKNRAALFETCRRLLKAPDEYAEFRLKADLMLSEKRLSEENATMKERAGALEGIVERYRGTPAEAESLLIAAVIASKLEASELEHSILNALDENFSDDLEVIKFRRKYLKRSKLYVVFKGTFSRLDDTRLKFPADTMGHISVMVFWSKNRPGWEAYLEKLREVLEPFPGLVDVFSFNLDELPDGGGSVLRARGLDWTVMRLPGGRNAQAYQAYAQEDPLAVLVNEYGKSVITPKIVHGQTPEPDPIRISEARYMAQLQFLFIGEFLVGERDERPTSNTEHRTSKLGTASSLDVGRSVFDVRCSEIQACFVPPPFRYRLTREDALANYRKAAELCGDVLKEGGDARELRHVRDRGIIALLGMWNLACEPKYLEQAVAEATAALTEKVPTGADVVPRFCLAKAALRGGEVEPENVVSDFLDACGGDDAPASAVAAAAILALEAGSRERHETYRDRFLAKHGDDPKLCAFASFLRDQHHRYRLLRPNYTVGRGGSREYIASNGGEPMTNPFPKIELKKLDGGNLSVPKDTNGKLTFVLFVEPPPGATNDFPVVFDRNGKPTRNDGVRQVIGYASDLTDRYVNKDINFVTAFLTDDPQHVRFLMKTNGWSCLAATVPGGLANPMVRQLGILSADHVPNVFLLRRDGTIAWRASGLAYKNANGFTFALLLGMKVNVEVCDIEYAYHALVAGDFKTAARIFAGPYLPWDPDRFDWRSPRYHGKALAYMGLKDWDAALESIDTAIEAHKRHHFIGKRRRKAPDWRLEAASVVMNAPCDILAMLWRTKADILEKLGRSKEAASVLKQADEPVQPDRPDPYSAFHEKLEQWQQQRKLEL